jgi:ABC-2 type transport system permease protein
MKALIAAELLKLRTTRSLWVSTTVVAVFALVVPVLVALRPDGVTIPELTPASLADLLRAPAQLSGGAMLIVGLLASAGEFRYRTVLGTRLVEPRQARILTAKVLAMGAAGLAVGVLVELVAGTSGAVALSVNDVTVAPLSHDVPRVAATVPVLVALHGFAGVAVGTVVRSTAGAMGATLLWVFVVEGVVPVVTRRPDIGHWLPGGAAREMVATEAVAGAPGSGVAAALLAGYIGVLVLAAWALDTRREV